MYYETGLYIAYNCLANEIMLALIVCGLHSFVYSLFECSVLFATCSLQIFTGVESAYFTYYKTCFSQIWTGINAELFKVITCSYLCQFKTNLICCKDHIHEPL